MTAALMVVLALAALGPAEAQVIAVGERQPLAFALLAPTGRISSISSSEIIRTLAAALEKHTDLSLEPIDPAAAAECSGVLGCLAEKARPESGLLLVSSFLGQQGKPDRIASTLVDTRRAAAAYLDAPRDEPSWREAAEALLEERAVLARSGWQELAGEDDAKRHLQRLIAEELRPALEQAGRWSPYGAIAIDGLEPGVSVALDGLIVGTTFARRLKIEGVAPGRRVLTLERRDLEPFRAAVEVAPGRVATIEARLASAADDQRAFRDAVFWSGVGAGALGAALVTYAIVRGDGGVQIYCLTNDPRACDASNELATSAASSDETPSFTQDPNPTGVLLAPLGVALVAAGVSWALGTKLIGDEREAPWLQIAAGLVLGTLTYALGAALDGTNAFDERPASPAD